MKDKNDEAVVDERFDTNPYDFHLQKERIRKILDETIYKLRILTHLPSILQNDGEILRNFVNKTEADFVVHVCQEHAPFSKQTIENRSDLMLICNMLERINMYEKKGSVSIKKGKSFFGADHFDTHVAYAVDVIFKCQPLVEHMESLEEQPDSLMTTFIESMLQLEKIVTDRLSVSASEEIKRDNDLKTAYRSSMILSDNIQELEDVLEKQRQELGKEQDNKDAILQDLSEKIEKLKEKSRKEINRIVSDSEVLMMKDYNKSVERQEELASMAENATEQYERLLEDHLSQEKVLRAKRLKVETQLSSWIIKYDNDIGEKQAEFDELDRTYKQEKEELDALHEKFEEQEEEYVVLMREKEEEEQRIMEEKAWIFLQNRAARRIQRAWKGYRARKLARKKSRKPKKKGGKGSADVGNKGSGSGGGKNGKGKGKKGQVKKDEPATTPNPNALLEGKFDETIIGEIKSKEAFDKKDLVVDLSKNDL